MQTKRYKQQEWVLMRRASKMMQNNFSRCLLLNPHLTHTDAVINFESFRVLKLALFDSLRVLNLYVLIKNLQ